MAKPKTRVRFSMRMFLAAYLMFLVLIPGWAGGAEFYDMDTINTLSITFSQDNWDQLLDDLYAAGNEERLEGTVEINGVTYENVGIRYKGNSSYNKDRIKNPLNIKLDYINDDQTLDGYGTLKLANVYKDPSFVREVLSYEIAGKYMPAGQANFINVTINGNYIGLYTSVQDVDKYFLDTHFENDDNPFFKGEVDDIFNSGAIWGYFGANVESYYAYYEIESDDGWEELVNFFNIFNNSPSDVEDVLNVDRLLWMLAFDNLMVNLDAPINVAHNFYLYQDGTGLFNPILWDLNENFGAFKMLMNGPPLNTQDLQQLDPFLNENSSAYPIINKILSVPMYKKMYVAHMKTMIEDNFANGWYYTRALEIQSIIDSSVRADANKFYTYTDFLKNINSSAGNGPEEVIGLTELMAARITYLNAQTEFTAAPPVISGITEPTDPVSNSTIWFSVNADNATLVQLKYRQSGRFEAIQMRDDGNHNDGSENDGVYGISINIGAGDVTYYIYAENNDAAVFSPERAEYEYYTLSVENSAGDLVINEFMADNETTACDQDEEYDDWIELYNNSDQEISLFGYYLTDDSTDPAQWTFPDVSIAAGGYLIVWADKDEEQDGLHANFKLSASGETILLSDPDQNVIDEVIFGEQTADISMARYPNGTGDFTSMNPTFSAENVESKSACKAMPWIPLLLLNE